MIEEAFAMFVSTLVDAFNMPAPRRVVIWAGIIIAVMICAFGLVVFTTRANARDNGQFGPISAERKAWFESLKNQNRESCCADADGNTLSDVDWESVNDPAKPKVHYRVRLLDHWADVPDSAVVTTPNLYGRTIVWPYYINGNMQTRCFLPGSMT